MAVPEGVRAAVATRLLLRRLAMWVGHDRAAPIGRGSAMVTAGPVGAEAR
jgi:hypothetical protein